MSPLGPDVESSSDAAVALYVHIPYCASRCPYCDFNTVAVRTWPEREYAAALRAELRHYARETPFRGARVTTIYFGGGTPSLFAPATIGGLIEAVASELRVESGAEITLEANPGTVDGERLADFRAAGVNRLSLGVQSLRPDVLTTLGRAHSAADAVDAARAARAAGFENLSVDLIYAVPGQSLAAWLRDLAEVAELEPEHVSAYELSYEPGAPFGREREQGRLRPADEETALAMQRSARARLAAAGLPQYEISNYARPGREARHNIAYWRGHPYLGLGAGAHSYAPPELGAEGWGERWVNQRPPQLYLRSALGRGSAVAERETLDRRRALGEAAWLRLRQRAGLPISAFQSRFGTSPEEAFPDLAPLVAAGLLLRRGDALVLSERGLELADTVFAALF